jgi:hypothetical protein
MKPKLPAEEHFFDRVLEDENPRQPTLANDLPNRSGSLLSQSELHKQFAGMHAQRSRQLEDIQ